jgi:ankyrin repeat protein
VTTCEALLARGASVTTVCCAGRTALVFACRAGKSDCVALLLRHGANPLAAPDTDGKTPLAHCLAGGHRQCGVHLVLAAPPLLPLLIHAAAAGGASDQRVDGSGSPHVSAAREMVGLLCLQSAAVARQILRAVVSTAATCFHEALCPASATGATRGTEKSVRVRGVFLNPGGLKKN